MLKDKKNNLYYLTSNLNLLIFTLVIFYMTCLIQARANGTKSTKFNKPLIWKPHLKFTRYYLLLNMNVYYKARQKEYCKFDQ